MFITLPDAVLHVIQQLNIAGYEAYAVGGCVRDSLLGKAPVDWDVTTSASPSEMQSVFADFRTIETGIKHGTLTVLIEDIPIEITTYRIDGEYSDGRRPDSVVFTRSLSEDLQRRDFTVNAMAYHPSVGLVDEHGGQNDLKAGIIRCVGVAEQRFSEDALRIIRALRFASVLGYSTENTTDDALRALSPTLNHVAIERISTELGKLLCGKDVCRIVRDYADVLAVIMPEISLNNIDTSPLSSVPTLPHSRWAALFYAANTSYKEAEVVLRRLRMDTHTIEYVKAMLICRDMPTATDSALLRLLNRLDKERIFDYLTLCEADATVIERVRYLLENEACYKISMLNINGNDVLKAGIAAGPDVGRILQQLLDAVMDGICVNRRDDLLEYIHEMEKPVQ